MSKLFQYNGKEWIEITGRPGKDGISPDPLKTAELASKMAQEALKPIIPVIVPDTAQDIADKLNEEEEIIDQKVIKGLQKRLEDTTKEIGTKAGWGAHPLRILDDGVVIDKVARTINFTGGTVSRSADGVINIAHPSTPTPSLQAVTDVGATTTNDISVPDEVYSASWNASVEVPTKNAVYDKIESLAPPLTTKGDIYGFSTVDARIPVGADGEVLTADSTDPTGVSWQTPSVEALKVVLDGDLRSLYMVSSTKRIPYKDRGAGITITNILVQCSVADPTTELNANIMYSGAQGTGAFPGASPTLVSAIDTTTGNYDSGAITSAIATGKELYLLMDADPTDYNTTWTITITYTVT